MAGGRLFNIYQGGPMRTLCDVCEAAPARVFCAADEAALCRKCDEKVHGCNKLASRHVRLTLAEARAVPKCDICENAPAFFFCGIDGTSLCLQCDMDVHVGGKKTHERYLWIGQRVEFPTVKVEEELGKQPIIEHKRSEVDDFYKQHHKYYQSNFCENGQEENETSNASAIAVAVGDTGPPSLVDQFASQMIDLNFRPHHLQAQAPGVSESVRDMELVTSNQEEFPPVSSDRMSKGKRPVDS